MFSQLFGNYLVNKGIITKDDYKNAIAEQFRRKIKIGVLAVEEGWLTVELTEKINRMQKNCDLRFGELAVEKGYLSQEQVDALLKKQGHTYMHFLEALLDLGKVEIAQIDGAFEAFQKEHGFSAEDMNALKTGDFESLIPIFAFSAKPFVTDLVTLVLKNINRFVSRDFYIGKIYRADGMEYRCLAGQETNGDHEIELALVGEKETSAFLKVASAYAQEDFSKMGEDALDAVCEFVNCCSGLFAAEQSEKNVELDMRPVYAFENQEIAGEVYVLPVYIDDEELKLVIGIDSETELGQIPYHFMYEKVESSVAIGLAKATVGIVDDSKLSRKLLRNILEEAGYAVIAEATDGEEGIATYLQYKPDILTMDITMPNLDGIESLREIKSIDRNATVVMISAAGQQKKIIEALKLGAEKFITKPFEKEDVLSCMDSLLKEK